MIGRVIPALYMYFVLILFHYRHKLYHRRCFDAEIHGYLNMKK